MTGSPYAPALPGDRLELSMPDLKPGFNPNQARAEAERCLYCHDAPCIAACPTAINIPEFIRKIATGNVRGAARTILSANILGYSCALVCPVEVLCVGACVYNHMDRPPIQIGLLQRFATEDAYARGIRFFEKGAPSGFRIACVGAGPASLACAHELARLGHEAVCLEARALPGGLNTTGCAPYKIRSETALREAEYVSAIGFEVRTGVQVGVHVKLEELEAAYDAIFLGVGLGPDSRLRLDGEDARGVSGACALIERIKNAPRDEVKKQLAGVREAVVVGGGNTGIDVARELARAGVPRVTQLYRRGEEQMSAYAHEVDYARKEGVAFRFWRQPVGFAKDAEGRVNGVLLARTVERDRRLEIEGSETEVLPAQLVAIATGQEKLLDQLRSVNGLELGRDGRIVADPQTGATGNPHYYAGGDAANGGKEVVNAAAEGKLAARGIDAALRAGKLRRRAVGV